MLDIKKKLQEEIAALEYELRNELPREILKARAHGDLSENAEYHAAKDARGLSTRGWASCRKRLADFSMIDMTKIPHDRVGLGSRVVVLDVKKDEEITYYLVTSEEADAPRARSPRVRRSVSRLLGKEVGDTVKMQAPGGTKELEILNCRRSTNSRIK